MRLVYPGSVVFFGTSEREAPSTCTARTAQPAHSTRTAAQPHTSVVHKSAPAAHRGWTQLSPCQHSPIQFITSARSSALAIVSFGTPHSRNLLSAFCRHGDRWASVGARRQVELPSSGCYSGGCDRIRCWSPPHRALHLSLRCACKTSKAHAQ